MSALPFFAVLASVAVAIAFIGRRPPDVGDDHVPKYLNSPDTDLFREESCPPGTRVALGGDTPGQQAAIRAYPLLQPAVTSITAVLLPDAKAPPTSCVTKAAARFVMS